jgi:hypothetical protein
VGDGLRRDAQREAESDSELRRTTGVDVALRPRHARSTMPWGAELLLAWIIDILKAQDKEFRVWRIWEAQADSGPGIDTVGTKNAPDHGPTCSNPGWTKGPALEVQFHPTSLLRKPRFQDSLCLVFRSRIPSPGLAQRSLFSTFGQRPPGRMGRIPKLPPSFPTRTAGEAA